MSDKYLGKVIELQDVDIPVEDEDTGLMETLHYERVVMSVLEYLPELDKYICCMETGDEHDGKMCNVTGYALDTLNWNNDHA